MCAALQTETSIHSTRRILSPFLFLTGEPPPRPFVHAPRAQVEKEMNFIKPKTQYTCNPCSSISMNNGLGSRGAPGHTLHEAATAPRKACPVLARLNRRPRSRAQCLL